MQLIANIAKMLRIKRFKKINYKTINNPQIIKKITQFFLLNIESSNPNINSK